MVCSSSSRTVLLLLYVVLCCCFQGLSVDVWGDDDDIAGDTTNTHNGLFGGTQHPPSLGVKHPPLHHPNDIPTHRKQR